MKSIFSEKPTLCISKFRWDCKKQVGQEGGGQWCQKCKGP